MRNMCLYHPYEIKEGKCFVWAIFLSNPQNGCNSEQLNPEPGKEKPITRCYSKEEEKSLDATQIHDQCNETMGISIR